MLKTKRWTSFQRLSLHLCRVFLEAGGLAIAEETFHNPEIVNRGSLQHEAVLLLKASFSRWSAPAKERLLAWMDRGWSEDAIRRWIEFTGQPVTDDAIQRIGDIWKRDHYAILRGQLPDPYQQKLDELVAKVGPARELGEPRGISGGAFGAVSPKAPDEFGAMSVAEIMEFLATWTPGTDIFAATAEGAARDLGAAVIAKLDEFVAAAGDLKRLDPTYVRAFFGALTSALKQKLVFNWKPVLDLAAWVNLAAKRDSRKEGRAHDRRPQLGLVERFRHRPDHRGIRPGPRRPVDDRYARDGLGALRPLTDDPSPSAADETPDPQNSGSPVVRRFSDRSESAREPDLTSISINTTRGRAMHAVFQYARWVRLRSDAARVDPNEPSIDLGAMPEVREVLEEHLDLGREPTRTIRSVYGDHLTLWPGWIASGWRSI